MLSPISINSSHGTICEEFLLKNELVFPPASAKVGDTKSDKSAMISQKVKAMECCPIKFVYFSQALIAYAEYWWTLFP